MPILRRLFPNCREVTEGYFKTTGIFPITHTVVVSEKIAQHNPWALERLYDAFCDADKQCWNEYQYPKRLSFPTAVLMLEEEDRAFGKDPWKQGLKANGIVLEKFMEYAVAQGYIPKPLDIHEDFWTEESVLAL